LTSVADGFEEHAAPELTADECEEPTRHKPVDFGGGETTDVQDL
jgi:hypothetical protein